MVHSHVFSGVLLCITLVVLTGCETGQRTVETLNDIVDWTGTVTLAEDTDVINVEPTIRLDADHFLIADAREAQFRVYRKDGSLINHFGSRGSGPGEFQVPVLAARLPNGEILGVDLLGKVGVFSKDEAILVRTFLTPFSAVWDLSVVDDTTAYVAATVRGAEMGERIHVLNLITGEVRRSFFHTPVSEDMIQAVHTAGMTSIAVRGDSIAATFALSDSVFFFARGGDYLGSVPMSIRRFRPVQAPPEDRTDGVAVRAWIDSFTMITQVYWLDDGVLMIQYQDRENMLADWRLLGMTKSGEPLFDLVDTPRLHAVSSAGELYFADPESLTPNVLAVGRLAID